MFILIYLKIIKKACAMGSLLLLCSLTVPLVIAQPASTPEVLTVTCPDVQHPYYKVRDLYFHRLLRMALEASGQSVELKPIALPEYNENRSAHFIESDRYDVHWLNVTEERERTLLPVRIPLYKGAIGWRVFFIAPERQAQFKKVKNLDDLKKMVAVLGHDWPDMDIFKQNHIPVEASANWEGMFKMLKIDRVQYFPRSIVEILAESNQPVAKGLAIEESLILKYPAAYYFFVKQDNTRLAKIIESGMQVLIQDGRFDTLFTEYFGDDIRQLRLQDRTIIEISTPELESTMPLRNEKLWFDINTIRGIAN